MTTVAKKRRVKRSAEEAPIAAGEAEIKSEPLATSNLAAVSGDPGNVVLSADETEDVKKHLKIIELAHAYNDLKLELARRLYECLVNRDYKKPAYGGHATFEEYVELEVKIGRRSASRLTDVWDWYGVQQGADPKLLDGMRELGWFKTAALAKVIDTKNMGEWIEIAKRPYEDLMTAIKAAKYKKKQREQEEEAKASPKMNPPKGMTPDDPEPNRPAPEPEPAPAPAPSQEPAPASAPAPAPEPAQEQAGGVPTPTEEELEEFVAVNEEHKSLQFRVPTSCLETVEDALAMAREIGNTKKTGYPLVLICQHFLTFNHNKKTVVIGEWLKAFERVTGLKVIAIDESEQDVVYGRDYIRDMATALESMDKEERDEHSEGDGG